ncbi:HET-domain-containing protein [Pleomassaria siparia CBS 279.74]|uniref:HET-domain-containing protein n=1 Tax=Pleomassaria siparia CBS 279.74 TaxID=1314801 RepID=A0A6G1JXR8_9PLEO|nr:HET-domain-containing protein [Pleomassaria siparia CBS 279.74]
MRLLHAETLEFRWFDEKELPKYIILSHTWGNDEVSYQDMCWLQKLQNMPQELKANPLYALFLSAGGGTMLPSSKNAITERAGYAKIAQTARIALGLGYQYFWVDTCCIDKTSSAELQEAINSMFRWYQTSVLCVVFLADVERKSTQTTLSDYFTAALRNSKWSKRGWTLQELLAPHHLSFYNQKWNFICDKQEVIGPLEAVTGIPSKVLRGEGFHDESVARRLSWASHRSTTRIEDLAYCLMGIFDIHMPMLYGEGDKAFIRLQEEILKNSGDDSLFAWQAPDAGHSTFRGLLARSPAEFKKCGNIYRGSKPLKIAKTNLGFFLHISLRPFGKNKNSYVATLHAANHRDQHVGIVLRKLGSDELAPDGAQFTRVSGRSLILGDSIGNKYSSGTKYGIYLRQNPEIPRRFVPEYVYCFHLRETPTIPQYVIRQVWPPEWWDATTNELILPETQADFMCVLWFEHQQDDKFYKHCPSFQLILGFSQKDGRGWCKILPSQAMWPSMADQPAVWMKALDVHGPFDKCGRRDSMQFRFPHLPWLKEAVVDSLQVVAVNMDLMLRGDKVCYIVDVGFTGMLQAALSTAIEAEFDT